VGRAVAGRRKISAQVPDLISHRPIKLNARFRLRRANRCSKLRFSKGISSGVFSDMEKTPEPSKRPSRDLDDSYEELRQLRKKVEQAEKHRTNLCGRALASADTFTGRDSDV
jgi:signal transduction protein with GAF and PtsI domain